ncbi:carboxylesterase family protein [Periconia macrospinosa]|uniref:Carboxylesterase family protein n=1 Tax=Periconia macrospinosa TaxID=97972 RepID=A0A2V1DJB2_9PLEO|nr:carboxylesterase family protein [Periconia macrospinosa]
MDRSVFVLGLVPSVSSYSEFRNLLVNTSQGLVHGIQVNDNVNAFLGLPYAEPPVGELRWKPPQPLRASKGHDIFDASHFGNSCYQFQYALFYDPSRPDTDLYGSPTPQSEDCLTLNVFVPRSTPSQGNKSMPVFVWQHGGGFVEGSSSLPIYNASKFVEEARDIIVVTTNYRMSLFGFPNTPGLPPDGQNLGIRDQRAALEWVRDNIAAFGGDPDRIVHGGQSAGAGITDVLAYQYPEDPIFKGIVLQSGTVQLVNFQQYTTDSEFIRVAKNVGCTNNSNRKQELECMKTIRFHRLSTAISNKSINAYGDPNGGSPCVDNVTVFSREEYINRTLNGRFARVPTLLGVMDREGDAVTDIGPNGPDRTQSDRITNFTFNCPAALSATGRAAHGVPVWRYRFMGVFPSVTPLQTLGAYHGADVPFLWGTLKPIDPNTHVQPNEIAASKYLMAAFAAFVRDPEAGLIRHFQWPTYDEDKRTLIELFRNETPAAALVDPKPYDVTC